MVKSITTIIMVKKIIITTMVRRTLRQVAEEAIKTAKNLTLLNTMR